MDSVRNSIKKAAKQVNSIHSKGFNVSTTVYSLFKAELWSNATLQSEQEDRIRKKHAALQKILTYKRFFLDIVEWSIDLWAYKPNYTYIKERWISVAESFLDRQSNEELDSKYTEETIKDTSDILRIMKWSESDPWYIIRAIESDFFAQLRTQLNKAGAPKDFITVLRPGRFEGLGTYAKKEKRSEKEWLLSASRILKGLPHQLRTDTHYRFYLRPVSLIDGFDFKKIFLGVAQGHKSAYKDVKELFHKERGVSEDFGGPLL